LPGYRLREVRRWKNLFACASKHQQARRWRSQNVHPPIRAPLHRAKPGAYARNIRCWRSDRLVLSRYAPRRARQQTRHAKELYELGPPLSHESSDYTDVAGCPALNACPLTINQYGTGGVRWSVRVAGRGIARPSSSVWITRSSSARCGSHLEPRG